jgi:hypothetical protein
VCCSGESRGQSTITLVRRSLLFALAWGAAGAVASKYVETILVIGVTFGFAFLGVMIGIVLNLYAPFHRYVKVSASQEAEPMTERKEYVFVDFNAWEFAGSDELWTGLIRNM